MSGKCKLPVMIFACFYQYIHILTPSVSFSLFGPIKGPPGTKEIAQAFLTVWSPSNISIYLATTFSPHFVLLYITIPGSLHHALLSVHRPHEDKLFWVALRHGMATFKYELPLQCSHCMHRYSTCIGRL